jgi:hypothetical protein
MSLPKDFAQKVAGYSDVQLAQILESAQDYSPEALKIVMSEWDRRKLSLDAVVPAIVEAKKKAELEAQPNPTKPQTFRGIGFVCYGRDYARSVGYVTTQWFCIFFVPVFPVQSFYVDQAVFGGTGVASAVRVNLRQVARVYLFLVFMALFAYGVVQLCSKLSDDGHDYWALAVAFTSALVPLFVVEISRRRTRRNRPNQAPLPTPMSVTDRADARSAPATGAAEL